MKGERISIGGLSILKGFGFFAFFFFFINPLFKIILSFINTNNIPIGRHDLSKFIFIGVGAIAVFLCLDRYWQVYVQEYNVVAKKMFKSKTIPKSNIIQLEILDEKKQRKGVKAYLVTLTFVNNSGKQNSIKFLTPANFNSPLETKEFIKQKLIS